MARTERPRTVAERLDAMFGAEPEPFRRELDEDEILRRTASDRIYDRLTAEESATSIPLDVLELPEGLKSKQGGSFIRLIGWGDSGEDWSVDTEAALELSGPRISLKQVALNLRWMGYRNSYISDVVRTGAPESPHERIVGMLSRATPQQNTYQEMIDVWRPQIYLPMYLDPTEDDRYHRHPGPHHPTGMLPPDLWLKVQDTPRTSTVTVNWQRIPKQLPILTGPEKFVDGMAAFSHGVGVIANALTYEPRPRQPIPPVRFQIAS